MGDNPYAAEEVAKRELEEANAQQTEPAIDEKKETLITPDDEQQQRNLAICKEALESSLKDQENLIKLLETSTKQYEEMTNLYESGMVLKDYAIERLKKQLSIHRIILVVIIIILFITRFFLIFV